ncbi:DUF397 domain-containing protein [Streptomyces sp. NPDC059568]|uniref:DUF397 domain-containing protein n=1 Tax=unclassified Streptomyces TaxID=2593676 RepID=UPI0036489638
MSSSKQVTRRRKSSHSGDQGDCSEVASTADSRLAVRDSKNPNGPTLPFARQAWADFISGVKLPA